jgi:hypothetical protein
MKYFVYYDDQKGRYKALGYRNYMIGRELVLAEFEYYGGARQHASDLNARSQAARRERRVERDQGQTELAL